MWPLIRTTPAHPQAATAPVSERFTHFTRIWDCEPPHNRTAYPYTWRVLTCEWTTVREGIHGRTEQHITSWEPITN